MASVWVRFGKASTTVLVLLALIELIPHIQASVSQGWPGHFLPFLWANLALWVGGLHWYLPAAALAGGVAASVPNNASGPRILEVLTVAAVLAGLSFMLRGFVGPHLFYHASQTLLDMSLPPQADLPANLPPNDWSQMRRLTMSEQGDPGTGVMLAMVHSTVAFAILAAMMLPLGLSIGNGSRRFRIQARRRRAAWLMAAMTIVLVYAAQIAAWGVALTPGVAAGPVIYMGFLAVPLAILLTLIWSAPTDNPGDELQKLGEPGASR